jgi:hypothetical protein
MSSLRGSHTRTLSSYLSKDEVTAGRCGLVPIRHNQLPQFNDEGAHDSWREGFHHLQLPPAG